MLKAVIFALKLSHRVAETRGWISLKCIEAALVFWACKGVEEAGMCLGHQGCAEGSLFPI